MPLFVVERQHPVCMVLDLNRITEPKIGNRRGVMPDEQQIRMSIGVGMGPLIGTQKGPL